MVGTIINYHTKCYLLSTGDWTIRIKKNHYLLRFAAASETRIFIFPRLMAGFQLFKSFWANDEISASVTFEISANLVIDKTADGGFSA